MNRFNPRSVAQQMERYNLSQEEAETKVAEIIATKAASNPYSIEGQMKRFNITREEAEAKVAELKKKTATGHLISDPQWQMNKFGLTQEEAELKIKKAYELRGKSTSRTKKESPASHFNTVEYWQSKGFSLEEAEHKKAEHIKKMQSVFQEAIRNDPNQYVGRTPVELEYWTNRGYSEEEAKILRKERQRTFTLEKCISKYGEEIGFEVWRTRNTNWSSKMETMYKNGEYTRFCKHNYSNSELNFIKNLLNHYTPIHTYYCALPGNKQFFRHFKDSGITLAYDFVCEKKIIEFNGDYWHCNPFIYSPEYFHKFMKCTAQEKWNADKKKIDLIKDAGYEVLVIWESEYKQSPELIIDKCIKYLSN
jgi:hypothetical protein